MSAHFGFGSYFFGGTRELGQAHASANWFSKTSDTMVEGAMPIDLVFVRHGESEGNRAQERSRAGDDSDWEIFSQRHTSKYLLTDVGREQARITGEYVQVPYSPLPFSYPL